jgi:RNA polymerase sigma factor (sigma-70 family)
MALPQAGPEFLGAILAGFAGPVPGREAFAAMVRRYDRDLRSFLRRNYAPATDLDLDDVTQQLWLRLWQRRCRGDWGCDSAGPLYHYLCTAARNVLLDHLRKRRLRLVGDLASEDEADDAVPPPLQPEEPDPAERREVETALEDCIRELGEAERRVVQALRAGESQTAIARTLGVSDLAVHRLKRRAVEALRRGLASRGVLPGEP